MPRKTNLAAPKSALKKQAKKQLQLQPAQFGELETTPTSHHEKSPIPLTRRKKRASHPDCHNTGQLVDPDEFEDGIDDNDLAKLADTPRDPSTPRDREIVWSERDSETHRSSSMSSREEEQSGQVFGYIRDDVPFTSPASGYDAMPDTLPLSVASGNPSADCQSQPLQHVDFSETASTVYRSSPFGRSHTSRKSITTSQPASTGKKVVVHLVEQPLEPDPSNKDIPHQYIESKARSDENTDRDASAPHVAEGTLPINSHPFPLSGINLEAESGHTGRTLDLGDVLLDHISLDLPNADRESKPEISSISCDVKPRKKRKQRPKTPLQFDEDTQEVKSVSRQPLYSKLKKHSLHRDEENAIILEETCGKKRKNKASNDNSLQKKAKSSIIGCAKSPIVDDDNDRQCISQPCSPALQPPFKDRRYDKMSHNTMKKETQKPHLLSPKPLGGICVDELEKTCIEVMPPQSDHTRPQLSPVQITKFTEAVGDCIVVATGQNSTYEGTAAANESQRDFVVLEPHIKDCQLTGVEGGGDVCVSTDERKKTNSDNDTARTTRSSSTSSNVQISALQPLSKSKIVKKHGTDKRVGQNFSVSERGSPIPWQQQERRMDVSSTKDAMVTFLGENIPGLDYSRSVAQKCNLTSEKHRSQVQQADEWVSVNAKSEAIQKPDLIQQRNHHTELSPPRLSDIRRITTRYPNVNTTEHAPQSVTLPDRSRQQLHELVDIFMKRVDSRGAEILTVADGYKKAGDRCVEKIQSRFLGERRAVFEDATNHARRFHSFVSKGIKLVNSNSEKGSGLLQGVQQTISQRASLYDHAGSVLEALYEQLIRSDFGEEQKACRS